MVRIRLPPAASPCKPDALDLDRRRFRLAGFGPRGSENHVFLAYSVPMASANVVSGFGFGMGVRAPPRVVAPIVVKLLGSEV
jgi:hypothetical protein